MKLNVGMMRLSFSEKPCELHARTDYNLWPDLSITGEIE